MTLWALAAVLLVGCEDPPETARGRIARTPARTMYRQAKNALLENGIENLVWGATPFVSQGGVADQFRPTISLVSERLDIPMTVRAGKDYEDVESMLLSGEIDIAIMSPYAYVQAKAKQPDIRVFGSPISGGTETYGAYILTHEDSNIRSLADLRGLPFAFVSDRSTSGWLYPASRMLDEGLDPTKDVQGKFYGDHSRVIAAIASGEVAAGATYDGALAKGRGHIPGAQGLRVIARTRRIPRDAYVVRSGIPTEALLGLSTALSSVSNRDAQGREALAPLVDINGFVRIEDAVYRPVREIEAKVQALLGAGGGTLPVVIPEQEEGVHESDDPAPE